MDFKKIQAAVDIKNTLLDMKEFNKSESYARLSKDLARLIEGMNTEEYNRYIERTTE